jgi:hypothetical protein
MIEDIKKKIKDIEIMMQDPGFYSRADFQGHL